MTKIADIIGFVMDQSGFKLNRDEGVQHGPADREVRGVTMTFMATADVIAEAGERGDDLVLGHESLYYPYDVINMDNPPKDWQQWKINKTRRELLDQHKLSFLRLHGSLDELCILDDFAALLGLGKLVHHDGWVKVYEVESCSFDDMIERVKRGIGMPAMRVARPPIPEKPIRRVGLPWGGMGLFVNVDYQQQLLEAGCDVFIAGETDCYAFRFATECGIGVIETSHEHSEIPGLKNCMKRLQGAFPKVRFTFADTPAVWQIA